MKITLLGHDSVETVNTETGYFTRSRNGSIFWEGSESWVCAGAILLNNFGQVTKHLTLSEFVETLRSNKASLFYKNGKPKFRVIDIDHGTMRMWSREFRPYEIHLTT